MHTRADELAAGASGVVLTGAAGDDVAAAVRQAAAAPSSSTADDLAGAVRRRMQQPALRLTPRETEILGLLAQGVSVSVLAQRLYVSQSTAETHVAALYDKLGAQDRTQAIMAAVRLRVVGAGG